MDMENRKTLSHIDDKNTPATRALAPINVSLVPAKHDGSGARLYREVPRTHGLPTDPSKIKQEGRRPEGSLGVPGGDPGTKVRRFRTQCPKTTQPKTPGLRNTKNQ